MLFVILVLAAAMGFWLWSVNGAKKSKQKVVLAFLRAVDDRAAGEQRQPSWWRDKLIQQSLEQILASVPAKASPYDPDVIRQWLEAEMTNQDISTFLYHAETLGFSRPDQIALVPDVALMFLAQDLIKASAPVDKLIMLRLMQP